MKVKQIKWILNKALFLVCAYEGRNLTEQDYEDMIRYVETAVRDAKENPYCREILLDILECFDGESAGKEMRRKRS